MNLLKKKLPTEKPCYVFETEFSCNHGELTIKGFEYRPEGKTLPIVVICPDMGTKKKELLPYLKSLAEHGYAAYTFSYTTEMDRKSKKGTSPSSDWMENGCQDVKAVLQFITHLSHVNSGRIFLFGFGYGAHIAASVAAQMPKRIFRLTLCSPLGFDETFCETIKVYPGKVLLIHGVKEKEASPDKIKQIQDAYLTSCPEGMLPEKRVQLFSLKGAKHKFSKKQTTVAIEEIKKFASFYTKP